MPRPGYSTLVRLSYCRIAEKSEVLPLLHNNPIKLFPYGAGQVIVGTVMLPIQGEEPDET